MRKNKRKSPENILEYKICHKEYSHLGSHLWHGHHILSREYKEMFGLPYNMGLISDKIKEKKRKTANWQKTWMRNFAKSKKYQFKKGVSIPFRRISRYERNKAIEEIKKQNKGRKKFVSCPVCHIKYKHIESHLFNKHGLIKCVKKVRKK